VPFRRRARRSLQLRLMHSAACQLAEGQYHAVAAIYVGGGIGNCFATLGGS